MSSTESETTQLLSSEGGASNYNTATQGQGEEVPQGQETVENIFLSYALGGSCLCLAVLDGGHYCGSS